MADREPTALGRGVVPEFAPESEAAHWFDTHSVDALEQERVSEQPGVPRPRLETIAVRVSAREKAELQRRAERLGIGYTTYVRMLINHHVLNERPLWSS